MLEKCPKCGSTYIIGIEYGYPSPEQYDGISEWMCPKVPHPEADVEPGCGYRQGRWTGKELKDGEIEPRFGKKRENSNNSI